MQANKTRSTKGVPSPLVVLSIKLLTTATLILIVWPVPAMVSHTSPEDAVVLGRYTLKYLLLMTGYLSGVAIWIGLTGWSVCRLNRQRLTRIREHVEAHWGLSASILTLSSISILALRDAILNYRLAFPDTFAMTMRVVVGVFFVLLWGVALLAGAGKLPEQGAQWADARLEDLGRRLKVVLPRRLRLHPTVSAIPHKSLIGLVVVAVVLIAFALRQGLLPYPIYKDATVHMYIGQHLLRGGVPYDTVFYFHPPMRFVVSLLWAWAADLTRLPPVQVARVFNLCVAVGLIATTFALSKGMTGRPLGGLLAAIILISMVPRLGVLTIFGPNLKLTVGLFLALGVWMAQRGRWFWAGVLAALGAFMWWPAGVVFVALYLSAFLQDSKSRWKSALRATLGIMLVVGLTAGGLALVGTLDNAFRQTFVAVYKYLSSPGAGVGETMPPNALSCWYRGIERWYGRIVLSFSFLTGSDALKILILSGPVVLIGTRGLGKGIRTTAVSTVLFSSLLMVLGINLDAILPGDLPTIIALLAPLGAATITAALDALHNHQPSPLIHLEGFLKWSMVGLLLIGPLQSLGDFVSEDALSVSLADQQRMAEELDSILQPHETVQCFDQLWFLVLTDRDNALPITQIRVKATASNESQGWTAERIKRGLEAQDPVVIMLGPNPAINLGDWLRENYVSMGKRRVGARSGDTDTQEVFVRKGHEEIEEVIAGWPRAQ